MSRDMKCPGLTQKALDSIEEIYKEALRQKNTEILEEGNYKHVLEDLKGHINMRLQGLE